MGAEPLTDNEIENLKTFSDKRIAIKILHSDEKTKEEICEILGTDPDVVEDAIRVFGLIEPDRMVGAITTLPKGSFSHHIPRRSGRYPWGKE